MSNNYSSFLTSIIKQLDDPNSEIVALARDALIEIGINSPVKMSEALVKALTSYSSTSTCNRVEIIKVLHSITLKNFSTNLISTITYTILNLLTIVPPLSGEIVTECLDLLNTFCKMNATVTSTEVRSIPNNTSSIIDFFLTRIQNREMVFFISDNQPALPFSRLVENLQKTADDNVRGKICQLLTELSDVLIDTKTDLKILTPTLFTCIDVIMNTWSKGVQSKNQSDYYGAIGSVVNAVDILQLYPKFDKIVTFFNEALQSPSTRKAAAAGLPSVLSLIERVRDKPKIQSSTSAKLLFDFIDSEYINIQTDGSIMRSINTAVGGLTALLNVYPKSPLDVVLNRIPQPASFYVLNYYCNLFGDRYAKEIGTALSKVNLTTMSNETKSLYSNCFFTLIKKCGISFEKQETRRAEEKAAEESRLRDQQAYNEYYVAPIVYRSQEEEQASAAVKYEVPQSVPAFDDVLQKVAMFVAGDSKDASTRDAKIQFEFIVKQNPESFRYLYPRILAYVMTPSLFFSTPTLVSVCAAGSSFIKEHLSMIKEAKIDEFSLLATLLMLALSDLYIPATKAEFRKVIVAVAAVDEPLDTNYVIEDQTDADKENEKVEHLIAAILAKNDTKEFHNALLKAAQNNVASYVNFGGESPIHTPTNRSALLSANAKVLGFLLQSHFNSSQLDPVLTSLIVQMSPLDTLRVAAIAKFIGITASFNPEFAVRFLRANMAMVIANQENKLKFWKRKERPTLEPVSCTLAVGEIAKYAPVSFADFGEIVGNFNGRFIESKEVPNWAKMRTIEALVNRNTSDPKFSMPHAKIYSTRASIVIQEAKDSGTFISAVDALFAICANNVSSIERPEIVLGNTLKFAEKGFKPAESAECVSHVALFIQKVVSLRQMDNWSIIFNFHEITAQFLTSPNWQKFVDSMSIVVEAFTSLKQPNVVKLLQVVATYYAVSVAKNSEQARRVAGKVLSLIDPPRVGDSSSIPQAANEAAQTLIDVSMTCDIKESLSSLFSCLSSLCHSQLGSAAGSLLRAFTSTTQAAADPALFARECIKHSGESGDALVALFKVDSEKVVDLLLTEPFSSSVAQAAQPLFASKDVRHDAIVAFVERARLLSKQSADQPVPEGQSVYTNALETATSILSSVKYSIPYMEDGNGEFLLVELSIVNLKLKYDQEKTANMSEKLIALKNSFNEKITNSICDIFGAIMGDNSIFAEPKGKHRARMMSPHDAPQTIRRVFSDFVKKKKGETGSLFEVIKKASDVTDYVSQIVISIGLGQILLSPNTPSQLCKSIVDFLISDFSDHNRQEEGELSETSKINIFNRIIALSEIRAHSEGASLCGDEIIEFVLRNFTFAPGPSLNAVLKILPSLSDDSLVKWFGDVMKIVEQALSSKLVSSLAGSNVNALKVLMIVCSSSALSKSGTPIERLWSDYPLFLTTFYFCQEFSLITKALDLYNNRLGLARMTVPFGSKYIEECFREFVENNRREIVKAICVNPKRFCDALVEKVAGHGCPDVRALFAVFAMFIVGMSEEEVTEEIKEVLRQKMGELVKDPSEKVRCVLAFTLETQLV